jgi:hypothetical protein
MFNSTNFKITPAQLGEAQISIPDIEFRLPINQPTGNFFYDPWVIKTEFKNTIWEDILITIPESKGEARIIRLDPGTCYRSHADIDDRWHLSLTGEKSFIVNLENECMQPTKQDAKWHTINTSIHHSAVNFGHVPRIQLVVRQLLSRNTLTNPKQISITLKTIVDDRRFIFDDLVSPWLNKMNKSGHISDFQYAEFEVTLSIEESEIENLKSIISNHFEVTVL